MALSSLFGLTDRLLERALDGVAQRQRVTAHNIANVDTPGYKRYSLPFEEELKAALSREPRLEVVGRVTHSSHIPFGGRTSALDGPFRPLRDPSTSMRNDGNNVDIEAEMVQVAKDEVFYNALAQQVTKRYGMLLDAIKEGRR